MPTPRSHASSNRPLRRATNRSRTTRSHPRRTRRLNRGGVASSYAERPSRSSTPRESISRFRREWRSLSNPNQLMLEFRRLSGLSRTASFMRRGRSRSALGILTPLPTRRRYQPPRRVVSREDVFSRNFRCDGQFLIRSKSSIPVVGR